MPSFELLSQFVLAGLIIGVLYALMAVGITFIYSIMKLINWAMGDFYMIGSFVQFLVVAYVVGTGLWWVALPISMSVVFILGVLIQRFLIKPMFDGNVERKTEYATIITITMAVFLRSFASVLNGPYQRTPGQYMDKVYVGPLAVDGNRIIACISAVIIMAVFWAVLRYTWVGMALRAAAQNRTGIQTAGINIQRLDQIAFGIGVALAAAAGALLAPVFLVYPTNGAITTMKGFEIIIIGGLGSIPGALIAGILLGLIESLGAVFIDPRFQHVYGFVFLLIVLIFRPTGFFGEKERVA